MGYYQEFYASFWCHDFYSGFCLCHCSSERGVYWMPLNCHNGWLIGLFHLSLPVFPTRHVTKWITLWFWGLRSISIGNWIVIAPFHSTSYFHVFFPSFLWSFFYVSQCFSKQLCLFQWLQFSTWLFGCPTSHSLSALTSTNLTYLHFYDLIILKFLFQIQRTILRNWLANYLCFCFVHHHSQSPSRVDRSTWLFMELAGQRRKDWHARAADQQSTYSI